MIHLQKLSLLILLIIMSFSISTLNAQEYQNMPIAVQQKMDDNKVAGLDTYNGIEAHYNVELANLQNSDKAILASLFEGDPKIKLFSIEENNSILSVVSNANYTIKDIKAHVIATSASIKNFTVNYEVSE